jgi:methylated-DNA-[protein]-cysteine S-methyltransferase
MRCETILRQLDRYRTGEVSQKIRDSVEAHLARCCGCSAELTRLKTLAAGISRLRTTAPRELIQNVMEKSMDKYGRVETELGVVWVAFNERGITMILPGRNSASAFEEVYLRRRFRLAQPASVPESYALSVKRAAAGNPLHHPRLDLEGLSPFEQKALPLLLRIPRGEVRPYFWLAREAGNPKAVRAVGTAMARNPLPLLLPCHRVVPAQGGVGNYAFGSSMKRTLLEREGVPIEELDGLARSGVRYLGCKSTGIYCFPTCHDARRMKPQNRLLFSDTEQAAGSGYRPCQHCRP